MDWNDVSASGACSRPAPGDASRGGGGGAGERERDGAARARLYRRLFGPPSDVRRATAGDAFPVDVLVHPPGFGARDFFTMVTSGMSDRRMPVPGDAADAGVPRRAELVLYTESPPGSAAERLLRTVAALPQRMNSWIGHGHTLPNGQPPAPLFANSALSVLLVLDAILAPERDVRDLLVLDGDPVAMLWPVPITAEECALKVRSGTRALLDVFNASRLSCVLDPQRSSLA